MKKLFLSLCTVLVLFTACKKDNIPAPQPADPNAFTIAVTGKLVAVRNLPWLRGSGCWS